jgi:hypothetical protein
MAWLPVVEHAQRGQGRHVFCPIALKMMALILGCAQSKM